MSEATLHFPLELRELDPDFEFVRELGRGGAAVVYLARERSLGRKVAIKVVRGPYLDPEEALARLEREARVVARLEHPNIVAVHTVRRLEGGSLAVVMQYVPGGTLKEAILREAPFDFARAEGILRDVGSALSWAHEHGVVHRDVKPENVFLHRETRRAMLADFGIARGDEGESRLTQVGETVGTPAYMSPEQIDGLGVDARSDLYSLALVGWEMLTGEAPWEGEPVFSVIQKQKNELLPPLKRLRPETPARFWFTLEQALQKSPDARPATAEAFLAELADASPTANLRRWRSPSVWRRWFAEAAAQRDSARETETKPPPPVAKAPTVRYRSEDEEGESSAPKAEVEAEPASPQAAPQRAVAWLRDQLILPQAVWGSEGAVTRTARFAAELIAPAELERLDLRKRRAAAREEHEKELVRRRAAERERQEFIASLQLERAGPDRHPDWERYPHGRDHYELLHRAPGMTASRADLIMRTYGTVFTFLADSPGSVEQRTGNSLSRARADSLQRELRGLGIEPPAEEDGSSADGTQGERDEQEAHGEAPEGASAETTDASSG